MASQKSGSSKLLIASGSLVAVTLIFGVLYKTGNLSKQDNFELMGVIPEQVIVENTATETETPTAEIPQTQTTSSKVNPTLMTIANSLHLKRLPNPKRQRCQV